MAARTHGSGRIKGDVTYLSYRQDGPNVRPASNYGGLEIDC